MRGCLIDLCGALIAGSKSEQFRVGLRLAEKVYGTGDVAVIGAAQGFSFMGAAAAMGHASNAYDIDDGHNIIRAHPGTSFIGALLAKAYEMDLTLKELLTAMAVAYEATIRMGAAIMDYYDYAHSSGTFGAIGTAVGVGKMRGFSKEALNNLISIAEFNAPLVPGIRSVEYPSMNKDGVPFGVMIGTLALASHDCGFTGNGHLLEAKEYLHYTRDLGENYEVMSLYFKPYPCCRWAHPAIDACLSVLKENGLTYTQISRVVIKTFHRATLLSKIEPKTADEAQYNIAYPVAAALVHGDFGMHEVMEEGLSDPEVLAMMKRISFETDTALDEKFPAKRICRAEVYTTDGACYLSPECEPRGEAHEKVGNDWLSDKFRRIAAPLLTAGGDEEILSLILGDESLPVRTLIDRINAHLA